MRELLDNQFQNLFLWVPFVMAMGGAMYFTMPMELPMIPVLCIGTIICMVCGLFRRRIFLAGLGLFVFGFCYAMVFTYLTATPLITHNLRNIDISGQISKIDYTPDKTRLYITLNANQINNTYDESIPAIVRVNIDNDANVAIGDTIQATATLFRPSVAYAPETFDYARWAYFNHLSATGYINDYQITHWANAPQTGIDVLRDGVHHRAQSFLVDALVLGYKSAVDNDARDIWTAAGIGHVWSISGFHMTLVGGWLFTFFYLICRAIGPLTRRIPARIPAMILAWFGLAFYLFLSGTDVATIRAFLMTTLAFAAFILGRDAITMRNVCLAFCLIFLINPHYVMQAGFQLSFAAIFGLVWYFGDTRYKHRTFWGRVWRVIHAAIMTSVVATIFTTPFVAAHFYAIPTYSLVGNLILLPVFSLAIMPMVMVGTLTALVGWTGPLMAAQWFYDWTYRGAQWIASLPHATIIMPHIPNMALCMMILGLCCVMFIRPMRRRENYIIGAVMIIMGITITALYPRPMFYASWDGELVAFLYNNQLEFNKSRASNHFFAFDTWRQVAGEEPSAPRTRRKCPGGVCIYETPKWTLAYVQKYVPLAKNITTLCRDNNIDYIVSYFQIDAPRCHAKILRGTTVIYPSGHVEHVRANRRWHNQRT